MIKIDNQRYSPILYLRINAAAATITAVAANNTDAAIVATTTVSACSTSKREGEREREAGTQIQKMRFEERKK